MNSLLYHIGHDINVVLGTGSQDSWMYKFWSAPAGCFIFIGGIIAWYRHNKCHRSGCPLLGRHVPNYHHVYCLIHRPNKAEDVA